MLAEIHNDMSPTAETFLKYALGMKQKGEKKKEEMRRVEKLTSEKKVKKNELNTK
jgi:hypothetical protein